MTSRTMLNISGNSVHPCYFLDFRVRTLNISPFLYAASRIFIDALYHIESSLLILDC